MPAGSASSTPSRHSANSRPTGSPVSRIVRSCSGRMRFTTSRRPSPSRTRSTTAPDRPSCPPIGTRSTALVEDRRHRSPSVCEKHAPRVVGRLGVSGSSGRTSGHGGLVPADDRPHAPPRPDDADRGRVEHEPLPGPGAELERDDGEHPQEVPVREQQHRPRLAGDPIEHRARPGRRPLRPTRRPARRPWKIVQSGLAVLDLVRRQALVLAVVPLDEVVVDDRVGEPGEPGGLAGARAAGW